MKTYMSIVSGRLLDIIVYLDGEKIYSGKTEDAPDYIKNFRYSGIKAENGKVIYQVHSDSQ